MWLMSNVCCKRRSTLRIRANGSSPSGSTRCSPLTSVSGAVTGSMPWRRQFLSRCSCSRCTRCSSIPQRCRGWGSMSRPRNLQAADVSGRTRREGSRARSRSSRRWHRSSLMRFRFPRQCVISSSMNTGHAHRWGSPRWAWPVRCREVMSCVARWPMIPRRRFGSSPTSVTVVRSRRGADPSSITTDSESPEQSSGTTARPIPARCTSRIRISSRICAVARSAFRRVHGVGPTSRRGICSRCCGRCTRMAGRC